ncbi:nedd8-conjugating enzyme ubc12 [Anaeramoeba ignava]|uniref:Nedd8-conjugating enzyme ubc12 n=1 Tax=Anaeramoeba ignava TaxID=1746090 RepID=A0A9Q0LUA0_ANAIG|nr:nedd8-conjugating enzyme ubc12 [Anaeramoeba ignava]
MQQLFNAKQKINEETEEEKKFRLLFPRIIRDLAEIEFDDINKLEFPKDEKFAVGFKYIITPTKGIYRNGSFVFDIKIPKDYPHSPPKVICETKIFHTDIDERGEICYGILHDQWSVVYNLFQITMLLNLLFEEQHPDDPLNREAAELLKRDKDQFEQKVQEMINENSNQNQK